MSVHRDDEVLSAVVRSLQACGDAFFVARAVRDSAHGISDFVIVDTNERGGGLLGLSRETWTARSLRESQRAEFAVPLITWLSVVVGAGASAQLAELTLFDAAAGHEFLATLRGVSLGEVVVCIVRGAPGTGGADHYRRLLERSADVVVFIATDGLIESFFDLSQILGYRPEQVVGTPIDGVLSDGAIFTSGGSGAGAHGDGVARFRTHLRDRDGHPHAFSAVRRHVLDERGDVTGVVVGLHLVEPAAHPEEATREVDDHYKFFANFARDVLAIEREGALEWVSPNVESLTGHRGPELVGRRVVDLAHPDDHASMVGFPPSPDSPGADTLTVRLRHADDTYRWVNIAAREVADGATGEAVRLSSWRDAQGDVAARQALLASERRYRLLAENSTDVVLECDVDGVIRWTSPSALASLGWRGEDVRGTRVTEHVADGDRVDVQRQIDDVGALHAPTPIEVRYVTAGAVDKWMLQQVRRFRGHDDDGYVYIVTLHDIDDVVSLRDAAREATRYYQLLAENTSDVVYTVDLAGVVTWVSASVTPQLGWQAGEFTGRPIVDFIFDDDRPRVLAWRQLLHFGETLEELEIRLRHAHGFFSWMSVRAHALHDGDGRVTGVLVTLRNCDLEVARGRALRTITAGSRALMREKEPREMLRQVCQVAVDEGGYAFAWFGRKVRDEAHSVLVVAKSVGHDSYLDGIAVSWGAHEGGQGPTGRAIRLGHTVTVADAYLDPSIQPWRDRVVTHGFHSACAIPVVMNGEIEGTWQVYAREQGAFDPRVLEVLEDLALETGYALTRLGLDSL